MPVPRLGLSAQKRRTLVGFGLFAAVASVSVPAIAAPASSPAAQHSNASAGIASATLLALGSTSSGQLGHSLDVQRRLALQAERAVQLQKQRAKARARAARKASRARALKLRIWRSSHARMIPVSTSYTLSARFGEQSNLWGSGAHTGLDFDAPYGSPIRSTRLGIVSFAGWDGPYGNCVIVNHGHGLQTRYAHMSHISVRVGERVWAGQQVGRLGGTGNTTGPHLHFEVIKKGKPVDPAKWLW